MPGAIFGAVAWLAFGAPWYVVAVAAAISVAVVVAGRWLHGWAFQQEEAEPVVDDVARLRRTFKEVGNAQEFGRVFNWLVSEPETWIYRRVEQIEFESRNMARRRISIDFEIPTHALEVADAMPASEEGANDAESRRREFVPISVLRNWPPVLRFDLRDEAGKPLPLLSKSATNDLDLMVLQSVARWAFGVDDEDGDFAQVGAGIDALLERVVHRDHVAARAALEGLKEALEVDAERQSENGQAHSNETLDRLERLVDLSATLCQNTLLWVDVSGLKKGTRRIIKLSYDEPVVRHLLPLALLANTINARWLVVAFDVPHVGDANSYHLEISAPPSMVFAGARLDLEGDASKRSLLERVAAKTRTKIRQATTVWSLVLRKPRVEARPALVDRHVRVLARRAHMYAHGNRRRSHALATVRFVPERAGMAALLLVALAAAALVQGFDVVRDEVYRSATTKSPNTAAFSAAVALLLLAPAQLGFVVNRADTYLPSRQVAGARGLCVASVVSCVLCAALLAGSVALDSTEAMDAATPYLVWGSRAAVALLALSVLLPVRRSGGRAD